FAAVLSYYIHQNQIMWNRTQLGIAIQGAVLGGAYSLKDDLIASCGILFVGIVLWVILWRIIERDREIRDINKKLLDQLASALAAEEDNPDITFVLGKPPENFPLATAHEMLKFVFIFLLWVDIFLGIYIVIKAQIS
ncbi:MAG: hypothetical protein KC618_07490, partial [Candidatus Omnitrophica bacterium]|nr:hypothetical protein [Candidatus Omnitrophota bacterium]